MAALERLTYPTSGGDQRGGRRHRPADGPLPMVEETSPKRSIDRLSCSSWVNQWSPTRVVAELRRIEAERRFAPRKVEIEVDRIEVNLGKDAIIKFLNEHAQE
jgi:hypothetical protein